MNFLPKRPLFVLGAGAAFGQTRRSHLVYSVNEYGVGLAYLQTSRRERERCVLREVLDARQRATAHVSTTGGNAAIDGYGLDHDLPRPQALATNVFQESARHRCTSTSVLFYGLERDQSSLTCHT